MHNEGGLRKRRPRTTNVPREGRRLLRALPDDGTYCPATAGVVGPSLEARDPSGVTLFFCRPPVVLP